MCKEDVVATKQLTNDEANETLAMLADEEFDRAQEIVEEGRLEHHRLVEVATKEKPPAIQETYEHEIDPAPEEAPAPAPPRDMVFPNEKGPMTLGSIDRKPK